MQDTSHLKDFNGLKYAGDHLLIEMWDCPKDLLNSAAHWDRTFRAAVDASGATLLRLDLHEFQPSGITGVAILAESHMSVHTWPEQGYAAVDVFMCGKADPRKCLAVFKKMIKPREMNVDARKRGLGI